MSKEGEMLEYLLNFKMLNLFSAESGSGKSHSWLFSAAVNQFCSFLSQTFGSPKLQLGVKCCLLLNAKDGPLYGLYCRVRFIGMQ
jgi:hypothetical protein